MELQANPASEGSFETYRALRDQGRQAAQEGLFDEALELFERAGQWAEEHGDQELIDRAFCNLSALRIEIGERDGCVTRLREILMRNTDPLNSLLAAYNIAHAYEIDRTIDKGLFYGRIALKYACQIEDPSWQASAHNLIGNLHLAVSATAEATSEYEAAFELLGDGDGSKGSIFLGKVLDNLGYCRVLDSRHDEGFRLLFRSLRMLRRFGRKEPLISTHVDLAFAHLDVDRPRSATRHAETALDLARELNSAHWVKNALLLLGQSASMDGDTEMARRHFVELQQFYPGLPVVTDLLLSFDLRKIVNLRA